MSITTTATLTNTLTWTQTDESSRASTRDVVTVESSESLTNGTGNNQANTVWFGSGTLASGGSADIDLLDLTRNLFGSTLTTSLSGGSLKFCSIKNTATGVGQTINVTNAVTNGLSLYSNGLSSTVEVAPGGSMTISNPAGWSVSTLERYLRINDEGQGASYEIGIVGVS